MRICMLRVAMALVGLAGAACAVEAMEARSGTARVRVRERATGEPVMAVHYAWKVHAEPSIEVCRLPADEGQWSEVRPLFFRDRFMKGKLDGAIYQCLNDCEEVATSQTEREDEIDFKIFGDRNSLGKPAVSVGCRPLIEAIEKRADRAIFGLLEPWASDKRMLLLDLPEELFAEPGKLRVWFLRGERVLWSETVAWPGVPE